MTHLPGHLNDEDKDQRVYCIYPHGQQLVWEKETADREPALMLHLRTFFHILMETGSQAHCRAVGRVQVDAKVALPNKVRLQSAECLV